MTREEIQAIQEVHSQGYRCSFSQEQKLLESLARYMDDWDYMVHKVTTSEKEIENLRSQLVAWIVKAGYDPTHSLNEWGKRLSDYM